MCFAIIIFPMKVSDRNVLYENIFGGHSDVLKCDGRRVFWKRRPQAHAGPEKGPIRLWFTITNLHDDFPKVQVILTVYFSRLATINMAASVSAPVFHSWIRKRAHMPMFACQNLSVNISDRNVLYETIFGVRSGTFKCPGRHDVCCQRPINWDGLEVTTSLILTRFPESFLQCFFIISF